MNNRGGYKTRDAADHEHGGGRQAARSDVKVEQHDDLTPFDGGLQNAIARAYENA
jgi:hypothetical protein